MVAPADLTRAAGETAELIAAAPRDALVTTKAKIVAGLGLPATARTLDL